MSLDSLEHQSPGTTVIQASVLVVGGGPVGLTLSALLSKYGIKHLLVEADDRYCTGSRAICLSRRSQEIFSWVGADKPLLSKALSWVGGRTYFQDQEVLHFKMHSEPDERFGPMVNIQQFYVEQLAHEAAQQAGDWLNMHWSTKLLALVQDESGVDASVEHEGRILSVRAQYLVACDGGRSTVRELMGLQLEGVQYEGKYVIVDIAQKTKRAVERLAWFDPPSNPGSTLLMHRQPDDVWRIDYQVRDDEDPAEAVLPENVLPRVQSHLTMIGETEPWKPLWISIYNAKCLTLPKYRYGRVLFAGDAGHLVPIFGVRGLNSGVDDVANLAWKLALVLGGEAPNRLLDSYSSERVYATRQNIGYGAKSTEFMAPPHFGFKLMREAALRLSLEDASVRSLANPRQSTPINYEESDLNIRDEHRCAGPKAGEPAPEALLSGVHGVNHLSELFGRGFVLLHFLEASAQEDQDRTILPSLRSTLCDRFGGKASNELSPARCDYYALNASDVVGLKYAAQAHTCILIRPDGYILARWPSFDARLIRNALTPFIGNAIEGLAT